MNVAVYAPALTTRYKLPGLRYAPEEGYRGDLLEDLSANVTG